MVHDRHCPQGAFSRTLEAKSTRALSPNSYAPSYLVPEHELLGFRIRVCRSLRAEGQGLNP